MENFIFFGSIAVAILLIVVLLLCMYVKAPPSVAFILSGLRKEPRVLIGTGGFKVPIIERLDKMFLGQVTVDVKTSLPVPTHDFIDVSVDAVCKVRALPTPEGTRLAAKNFLNMEPQQIAGEIRDSLEGNMREVVGAIDLAKLVTDQNISEKSGLIENLGADNTFRIRKDAAITKANAEKEISIAESNAKKEANDVRVKTETEIAERNNELAIKQADLKKDSDTRKAIADAAYMIQQQEQQKTVNEKTVDAEIAKTIKEQVLADERVKVTENTLRSEVNARADAEKYETEINAQAKLEQEKRAAEAKTYLAEQEAKAVRAKAEAAKYAALQEAEGIKAKGEAEAAAAQAKYQAEAEGIRAKGNAEAEAMEKKAEAYKKSDFAKLEMVLEMQKAVLPQVAENVAKPMGQIKDITIYGSSGQEAAGVSQNVPAVMKKTFDIVKDTTGVDLADVMKSETIAAKTDKNILFDSVSDINIANAAKATATE